MFRSMCLSRDVKYFWARKLISSLSLFTMLICKFPRCACVSVTCVHFLLEFMCEKLLIRVLTWDLGSCALLLYVVPRVLFSNAC
jgi:hypothetical protein